MDIRKELERAMPSVDDLFTTQEQRDDMKLKKIHEISIDEIDDFPDHPYQVRDDEDMMNLVESVKEYGILTPATVRKKEDGRYELLSGHRRKRACEIAGITELRCEIVEMDRDEATIFMVDSNLQRTTILPSEKAKSYKMRLDAMHRKAGRPSKEEINSVPLAQDLRGRTSRELLGEQVGESQDNVRRYIRLNELIPGLLDLVDEGKIGLRPAVELSYIPKEAQEELLENIEIEQCTPTHAQALRMKKMQGEGRLTPEVIACIMQEEKPNQNEKLVLRGSKVNNLFPSNLPLSKREEYIVEALKYYGSYYKMKQREEELER